MFHFFDTYALVEITKKNPSYVNYFDEPVSTSLFNLIELYYACLKDFDEEKAIETYYKFKNSVIPVTDEIIFEAMKFRKLHINKKFSYIDCIGYNFALKNNLKFLTGDKAFEGMENVEFVK